ncbi:MAG: histidinol dehydrogenase [Chitinivibrionales bacterium]|nr:histidinol dehydrogenase [Chitinivibrionales bacterium]
MARTLLLDMSSDKDARALRRMLAKRRSKGEAELESARGIIDDVRTRGDRAVFEYTQSFDKVSLTARSVRLDSGTFAARAREVPADLKAAIRGAAARIRAYHQRQALRPFKMKTAEGVLSQEIRPLRRVGVYVPGGHTVYPSSVLMNVIPAQVAGVDEIVVVTPPRGELNPVLAYTFSLLKLTEVYQIGGAQAVAALALGTRSVPRVDKIVGPGRNIVALAKQLVYGLVDIDMIAGSSEIAILADSAAPPRLIALDMLSQAEHGSGDELAVLITESRAVARRVAKELEQLVADSPVRTVLAKLPSSALTICITPSRERSIALVNELAPEHLQIMTTSCRRDLKQVRNAGAVFLGENTPVPLGDYYVGTNHVLPTAGAARYASGLGTDDFQKRMSVAEVTRGGIARAASRVAAIARAEAFEHHAMSVEARLDGSAGKRNSRREV